MNLLGKYTGYGVCMLVVFLFTLVISPLQVNAVDVDQKEKQLREELERIEKERVVVEGFLGEQKQQSASLERDVSILEGQIRSAQLNIDEKNVAISHLGQNIELKDRNIQELGEKIENSKDSIAQLIKKTRELDEISLIEVFLSGSDLSDFFVQIDSFIAVKDSIKGLVDEVEELKDLTEVEKKELQKEKDREQDAKYAIETERRVVARKEAEKQELLQTSKLVEQTYVGIISEKQERAAQIRAALFTLRDSAGIPFGDALRYAQAASRRTGVRAAFILAILKQESNLGTNVGTCNRPGDPDSKKWFSIMPGPNDNSWRDDQTIYKSIVKKLGRPIVGTPLSCPWQGGWGGAMGPSQFIPATWASYAPRIASVLGVTTADPWNPEHAFTATGLYVKDLGADAGGYTAERRAALKYYAGSNWSLPKNAFYGNGVMKHAQDMQEQINFLEGL